MFEKMDNLLEYFVKEPEREFHVRELAKLINKSPTTVSKYLAEYGKKGILSSRKRFGHSLYKAKTESQSFKNLKLSYNIEKLKVSGLIKHLEEEYNHPEAIILFGSFAKAENIPRSDIDIFVLTPIKDEINLSKFEKIIGNKIQLFLRSKNDIEKMKLKNKELLNSFINGIVLSGHWEVFR